MKKATLIMTFTVRGFRSFLQKPRRRRRRCVSSERAILLLLLLATARHPLWVALTVGPRPTENGNRRLNPCLDAIAVLAIASASRAPVPSAPRGASGPSAAEVVEGVNPPRLSELKLGLRTSSVYTGQQVAARMAFVKNKIRHQRP